MLLMWVWRCEGMPIVVEWLPNHEVAGDVPAH